MFVFFNFDHHKFTAQAKLQKEESSIVESHDQSVEPIKQESHQEPSEMKQDGLETKHLGDVICQSTESSDKLVDTENMQPQDMVLDDVTKERSDTGQLGEDVVQKSTKIQSDKLKDTLHAEELQPEGMVMDDSNKDRLSTGHLEHFVHASAELFDNLQDTTHVGILQQQNIVIGDTVKDSLGISKVKKGDVTKKLAKSPFDSLKDPTHADELKEEEMTIDDTIKEGLETRQVEEDVVCKLNKPTSQSLNDITLTEKFQSQGLVINKTAKEESASVIDVEHATLPMNDMPDVSNRTNAQVDLNPSECTNSPTDEKAVESHKKDSAICSGEAQESDIGKGESGVEKSSCPVVSDGMLGQEQDGETSSKKNGGKTGKQKSDDQGCLIQLFTGESDLKKIIVWLSSTTSLE